MEQINPGLHGFTFRNIWALDQPPLANSTLTGKVAGVVSDNVNTGRLALQRCRSAGSSLRRRGAGSLHSYPPSRCRIYCNPPSSPPGRESHSLRSPRPARDTLGSLATGQQVFGTADAACTIAFLTPRALKLDGRDRVQAASGFCSASKTRRAARTGRARIVAVPAGTTLHRRQAPHFPVLPEDLPRRMD